MGTHTLSAELTLGGTTVVADGPTLRQVTWLLLARGADRAAGPPSWNAGTGVRA